MFTTDKIKKLRELANKSTQVVAWHPHEEDGTIRGPFERWLTVKKVLPRYEHEVANLSDEVKFVAAALNNFVPLLNEIERLQTHAESRTEK